MQPFLGATNGVLALDATNVSLESYTQDLEEYNVQFSRKQLYSKRELVFP